MLKVPNATKETSGNKPTAIIGEDTQMQSLDYEENYSAFTIRSHASAAEEVKKLVAGLNELPAGQLNQLTKNLAAFQAQLQAIGDRAAIQGKAKIVRNATAIVIELHADLEMNGFEIPAQMLAPSGWGLSQNNERFTGRKKFLSLLASQQQKILRSIQVSESLSYSNAVALKKIVYQTIHGLAGVGKTQLAKQYAYLAMMKAEVVDWEEPTKRYILDYEYVAWIPVSKPEEGFFKFAKALQIETGAFKSKELIQEVYSVLSKHFHSVLLILDDVENEKSIQEYLPSNPYQNTFFHIVMTSKSNHWNQSASINLEDFDPKESIAFVSKVLSHLNESECSKIATLVYHFPLALSQAVAYLKETGETVAGYCESYVAQGDSKKILLKKTGLEYDRYRYSAYSTWYLSIIKMRNKGLQDGEALLNAMSFLSLEAIPRNLFLEGFEIPRTQFNELIKGLRDYSFITCDSDGAIRVHPLLQEVIRLHFTANSRMLSGTINAIKFSNIFRNLASWSPTFFTYLINSLNKFYEGSGLDFPEDEYNARLILPHMLAAYKYFKEYFPNKIFEEPVGTLCVNAARCYLNQSNYQESKFYAETGMSILEKFYNQENPVDALGDAYNNMFCVFSRPPYKNEKEALRYHNMAFAVRKKIMRHDLVGSVRRLADCYVNNNSDATLLKKDVAERYLNDLKQAISLYRSVIKSDCHRSIARALLNLGITHHDLGKKEEAENIIREALQIYKKLYPNMIEPEAILCWKQYGNKLLGQNKYEEAVNIYNQIINRIFSSDGRCKGGYFELKDYADCLHNIGLCWLGLKKYEQALNYFGEAYIKYREFYDNQKNSIDIQRTWHFFKKVALDLDDAIVTEMLVKIEKIDSVLVKMFWIFKKSLSINKILDRLLVAGYKFKLVRETRNTVCIQLANTEKFLEGDEKIKEQLEMLLAYFEEAIKLQGIIAYKTDILLDKECVRFIAVETIDDIVGQLKLLCGGYLKAKDFLTLQSFFHFKDPDKAENVEEVNIGCALQ